MWNIIYGSYYIHIYMEDIYIYIYIYLPEKNISVNWGWGIISLYISARLFPYDELCVLGQVTFPLSALVFPTA